ncbi:MAG: VOC family protein [Rhodospirillales bacterium]|jgi:catechol 2,3-dioxygenase-like lactoylglutathione lyase family enzyme|nr:VOC family protein [Rhodospirillales bacterium]MDP6644709.1 VOC family protein [Rhodospirillales bacterium]|tara:strand:- start:1784 stop:2335 length:552 start_codon:yes stop_codon:yes gene_type:complete
MNIKSLHHVAYRCNDAKETTDFYTNVLDMPFIAAVSETNVPSTGEISPYMHLFFAMADGSALAFFELPKSPSMQKDANTPDWVQHLAMNVDSMEELLAAKEKLESHGLEVVGPTDHAFVQSIYFFDPNGHRLELAYNSAKPGMMEKLQETAEPMLAKWQEEKKVLRDAAWVHDGSAADAFPKA